MSESIRVLVVDDHPLFRQGVVHVLGSAPDLTVVGEAASGKRWHWRANCSPMLCCWISACRDGAVWLRPREFPPRARRALSLY